MSQVVRDISQQANQWLIKHALPLWYDKGVDWKGGGYFEALSMNDLSCASDFKRLRVLTRQIYVFSTACKLGETYCKSALMGGLDFLLDRARINSGGFASRFSLKGEVIDARIDLYDLSFCLFAFAHSYRVLGDTRLKDEASSLVFFIVDHLRHPSGGFLEGIPTSNPRRQNPHMHLLEALIEWRLLSNDSIFIEISDEIVELFFRKFYFSNSGVLIEYFDDKLQPLSGQLGEITEPGHHFEWIWLLKRYAAMNCNELPPYSKLYKFAHLYGVCPQQGLLKGEVSVSGETVTRRVRLWPHTEWLKAELVQDDKNDIAQRSMRAWCALNTFLDCPQPGLWYETFDYESGVFLQEASPASSLYHIVLAIESLNDYTARVGGDL